MSVTCSLDHLIIAAENLDQGEKFLHDTLGVVPQAGGEHPRMGTHNRLLRLGNDTYLEVIAINPHAQPPAGPRWFQLDAPPRPLPGLLTWAARSTNIEETLANATVKPGTLESMTRGSLAWRMTIPEDGRLLHDGQVPALLQWDTPTTPPQQLPDQGCELIRLELHHPDADALEAFLRSLNFSGHVVVQRCATGEQHMAAHLQTPGGLVVLK